MRFKTIDAVIIEETVRNALASDRKRANLDFHLREEGIQRMLNAIEPQSYVRPHRHRDPAKVEVFLILKGKGAAFAFDDSGDVTEAVVLDPCGPVMGVEFPPGSWHTVMSLESGTVFYEIKDGPYDPSTDKEFAPWAPAPKDTDKATGYMERLKAHLKG